MALLNDSPNVPTDVAIDATDIYFSTAPGIDDGQIRKIERWGITDGRSA